MFKVNLVEECACGECNDLTRSGGATYGYTVCRVAILKQMLLLLLCFEAKGEYTEFSNSILPHFFLSFWATCPHEERFRCCFVTEGKRQWEVCEALKVISHKLAFVTSDYPAAAGKIQGRKLFSAKPHDGTTTLMTSRS